MRKHNLLTSSPRALVFFEAAARLNSFTRAAEELGVQQPSVSAAIKQLEAAVAVQLFVRRHRQVELTPAGKRLFADVSRSLQEIDNSLQAVRLMGQQGYVTISTSTAHSHYWLMPRLHLLRDTHPQIDLRMQNSDRDPALDEENLSLGIRLGDGNWPGYHSAKIANEIIYPVASPHLMAAATNLRSLPNLLHERLIHLEEPIRKRPTWRQWFAHHGISDIELKGGLRLNDYAVVLQAALPGEGFAFGWDHIVRHLIEKRILVGRPEWAWHTSNGIYLIWSKRLPISEPAQRVRDWIISVSDFPNG